MCHQHLPNDNVYVSLPTSVDFSLVFFSPFFKIYLLLLLYLQVLKLSNPPKLSVLKKVEHASALKYMKYCMMGAINSFSITTAFF